MEELSGVMALPEAQGPMGMAPDQAAIFEQIRQNVPRPEITQELLSAGEQADPQAVAEFKQELAGLELTPDELNKLNTMVDAILAAPQDYASLRRAYLADGMPEDLLPEQFDPAFFAALNMAIDTIIMNPASRPPMAMAGGGVANLAAYGRNGDTMLAHITPQEAAMLKRMGGAGTINPYTGLPEYANIFKKIGNAVKKFAKSTVGKIIIGAGLAIFAGPAAAPWLSGAAGSAGLTGLSGFLASTAGKFAVGGFLSGAGTTLAQGGSLKDALKAGAIGGISGAALAGITGGASAFSPTDVSGVAATSGQAAALTTPPLDSTLSGSLADSISSAAVSDVLPDAGQLSFQESMIPGRPLSALQNAPIGGQPSLYRQVVGDLLPGSPPPISGQSNLYQQAIGDVSPAVATSKSPLDSLMGPSRPYPPLPTSGSTAGGGVMDTLRSGFDKAVDFFNPNAVSADAQARAMQAGELARTKAFDQALSQLEQKAILSSSSGVLSPAQQSAVSNLAQAAGQKAYDAAYSAALPGTLARYAPLAAAGLGIMALGGGFKAEQPQMPDLFKGPTGIDLLRKYPELYGLRFGGIRPTAYGSMYTPTGYAMGGGVMDTPQAMRVGGKTYPRKTGPINGPGTGTSDSIPAMLSDGEFVFTAKAVRAMGNGSRRKGAKRMYKLMKMLEGKAA